MDLKGMDVSYAFEFTKKEFALFFRAVGKVAGAPAQFSSSEIQELRALNLRMARMRAGMLAQMHGQADNVLSLAEQLMEAPIEATEEAVAGR